MKYPFLFFVLLSFLLRLFRRSLPLFPFLGRRGFFCIGFASGCASLAIAPSAASRWSRRSQRSGLGREHTRPSRTPSLRLRRKGRRRIQGFYFYVFNVSARTIYMIPAWRVRCPLSRPSPPLASLVPRDKGKGDNHIMGGDWNCAENVCAHPFCTYAQNHICPSERLRCVYTAR